MTIANRLTDADIREAALSLGVNEASVRAVVKVESNGKGFVDSTRPTILFERHIFRRRLMAAGRYPKANQPWPTDIVNASPGGYAGGSKEWDRMARAIEIDRACALESASWGLFQIMGFHWQLLGFETVQKFVNAMFRSEGDQLKAFVAFIKANPGIHRALIARNWADFARLYNGPNYSINKYDTKLASAYKAAA